LFVIPQTQFDLAAFRDAALNQHNTYRANHHAASLTYSEDLNTSAQNWANQMASTGVFQHSGTAGVGENIYNSWASDASVDIGNLGVAAVKSWYDEVNSYDYSNPEGSLDSTGHFTQVVWKGSTQVGFGAAQVTGSDGSITVYVVCQYTPPGNMQGAFADNVHAP
jgi:uncharacterized protein YkwD